MIKMMIIIVITTIEIQLSINRCSLKLNIPKIPHITQSRQMLFLNKTGSQLPKTLFKQKSLQKEVCSLKKAFNIIKKRLQHICFLVNIAKFSKAPILKNICKRLLLSLTDRLPRGLIIPKIIIIKKNIFWQLFLNLNSYATLTKLDICCKDRKGSFTFPVSKNV